MEKMRKSIAKLIHNGDIKPTNGDYMGYDEITDEQFEHELQYQLQRELAYKQLINNLKIN